MAIQFVGAASATGTSTGYTVDLTALSGGIASSPSTGDLVVVVSAFGATVASAPSVSGDQVGAYTDIETFARANDTWDTNLVTQYAVMGGTPDATLTVTRITDAAYGGGTIALVWRGVDTSNPFNQNYTRVLLTNGSRADPPDATPTVNNSVIIAFGAGMQTTSGSAFTTPSELTGGNVSIHNDGTTSDIGVYAAWIAGTLNTLQTISAPTDGTTSNSSSGIAKTIVLAEGAQTLTPSLYTNTQVFYSPTVTAGTVTLVPSLYTNTQTFYSATVVDLGVNLYPQLYSNNNSFYAPTVTAGTITLTPSLYTNTQAFYAPTSAATYDLTPALYTNSQTFYSATVNNLGVILYPQLYSNENSFYAPTVTTTVNIAPDLFTNSQTFYAPLIEIETDLFPELFVNSNVFYNSALVYNQELTTTLFNNMGIQGDVPYVLKRWTGSRWEIMYKDPFVY